MAVDDEELRASNEQTGSANRYGYDVASQEISLIIIYNDSKGSE